MPDLASDAGYSLVRLGQDLAAIDHELLTRDVGRLIGREEQHGIADVLDGAQSLQWNRGCHCPQIIFAQSLQPFSDDVARMTALMVVLYRASSRAVVFRKPS